MLSSCYLAAATLLVSRSHGAKNSLCGLGIRCLPVCSMVRVGLRGLGLLGPPVWPRALCILQVLVPLGFVPLGFVPLGFVPLGFVPLGFVPSGFVPLGFVPLASCLWALYL